jgi:hypothetical protein
MPEADAPMVSDVNEAEPEAEPGQPEPSAEVSEGGRGDEGFPPEESSDSRFEMEEPSAAGQPEEEAPQHVEPEQQPMCGEAESPFGSESQQVPILVISVSAEKWLFVGFTHVGRYVHI